MNTLLIAILAGVLVGKLAYDFYPAVLGVIPTEFNWYIVGWLLGFMVGTCLGIKVTLLMVRTK